jgi:hypothetical protein
MNRNSSLAFAALIAGVMVLPAYPVFAAPDDVEVGHDADANGQAANFRVNVANFDQWVFPGMPSIAAAHERVAKCVKLQIGEVDRVCGLTADQQQKLQLAAAGDVRRFFDQVEVVRKKFLAVKDDQNAFGQIWQDIQPLQLRMSGGMFGDATMFGKTLRKTLSDEQLAKYDAVVRERRQYRYRASIEVALAMLENTVALRSAQHDAIVDLLVTETQPPDAYGQQDYYYVFYRLANLPEELLRPLMDDRQWDLLGPQLNQYRNMMQFLVQQGMIARDEGDATKKKPTRKREGVKGTER